MEQILCLSTKRTDETVLICGKSFGHKGSHYDPEDKVAWEDELPQEQPDRKEDIAA